MSGTWRSRSDRRSEDPREVLERQVPAQLLADTDLIETFCENEKMWKHMNTK